MSDTMDMFAEKTLGEARREWKMMICGDGGPCPCCDRFGKIYARTINRTMAKSLVWLHNQTRGSDRYVDVPQTAPKWITASNQLPTLRWWGLVERPPHDQPDIKKHSGMWRLTTAGRFFVTGLTRIPRKVWTLNGEPVDYSTEETDITDCFSSGFDYAEVMAGRYADTME